MPARIPTIIPLILFLALYGYFFIQVDQVNQTAIPTYPTPIPLPIQQAASGYLHQLAAESLYIKAAVYLGGLPPKLPHHLYADNLAYDFSSMVSLHPYLMDTYYLSESSLAWLGSEYALKATEILKSGMQANSNQWIIPFFAGFNYFYFLQEPVKASHLLLEASKRDGAPKWIAHLATTLAAKGGEIRTGLIWLKLMLSDETDPASKTRYEKDVHYFEQALSVQNALNQYKIDNGYHPTHLTGLIPDYLHAIPKLGGEYILVYEMPYLRMQRNEEK